MPVSTAIEHIRDIVVDEAGQIEQIYNHLIYRFEEGATVARAYLDEPDKVSILSSGDIPDAVIGYLQDRFWQIDRLGPKGYQTIWVAA